jgi:outer membrane protein, heavy metal efflux system
LISAQLSSHVNLTEIERLTGISLSANSKEKN